MLAGSKKLKLLKRRGVRLPRSGSGVVQRCPRETEDEKKRESGGEIRGRRDGMGLELNASELVVGTSCVFNVEEDLALNCFVFSFVLGVVWCQ